MKSKIVTIMIVWLVVAIAATSSIAFLHKNKEIKIAKELVAKADLKENGSVNDEAKDNDDGKVKKPKRKEIDSPLRSKEEIMADLDKNMEAIIFDEE